MTILICPSKTASLQLLLGRRVRDTTTAATAFKKLCKYNRKYIRHGDGRLRRCNLNTKYLLTKQHNTTQRTLWFLPRGHNTKVRRHTPTPSKTAKQYMIQQNETCLQTKHYSKTAQALSSQRYQKGVCLGPYVRHYTPDRHPQPT